VRRRWWVILWLVVALLACLVVECRFEIARLRRVIEHGLRKVERIDWRGDR
jgi:predicted Holliday junction resolvase-like endonuclease